MQDTYKQGYESFDKSKLSFQPYVQVQEQLDEIKQMDKDVKNHGLISQDILSIINDINRIPAGLMLMKQCNKQDQSDEIINNIGDLRKTNLSLSRLQQQSKQRHSDLYSRNSFTDMQDIQIEALQTDEVVIEDEETFRRRMTDHSKIVLSKNDITFYGNKADQIMKEYQIKGAARTDEPARRELNVSQFALDDKWKNANTKVQEFQDVQISGNNIQNAQNQDFYGKNYQYEVVESLNSQQYQTQYNNQQHNQYNQKQNTKTNNQVLAWMQSVQQRENDLLMRERAQEQREHEFEQLMVQLQQQAQGEQQRKQQVKSSTTQSYYQTMQCTKQENQQDSQQQDNKQSIEHQNQQKQEKQRSQFNQAHMQVENKYQQTNQQVQNQSVQTQTQINTQLNKKAVDLHLVPQVLKQDDAPQIHHNTQNQLKNNQSLNILRNKQSPSEEFESKTVISGKAQLKLSNYEEAKSEIHDETAILTKSQFSDCKFSISGQELWIRSSIGAFITTLDRKNFSYNNGILFINCSKQIDIINKNARHEQQLCNFLLEINDPHADMWFKIRTILLQK